MEIPSPSTLSLSAALIAATVLSGWLLWRLKVANRRADSMARALRVMTDKLDFQTHHDMLTGLPNSEHFEAVLDETLRSQPPGPATGDSLLYFDLDQFKAINDACGHAAGDELVKQVAWRVRRLIRNGDTLARLEGNAFAALLPACGVEDAQRRAGTIRKAIDSLRFHWGNRTYIISASLSVLPLDTTFGSSRAALFAAERVCRASREARESTRSRPQPSAGPPAGNSPTLPPADQQVA